MIRRLSPAGLFLAFLAVAVQLAFGALAGPSLAAPVPAQAGQDLALLAALLPGAGILCHTDADEPAQAPASPGRQHRHGDCAICPLCAAFAQPAATPVALPLPPPPPALAVGLAAPPPQATAPPRIVQTRAQPRAPPFLT